MFVLNGRGKLTWNMSKSPSSLINPNTQMDIYIYAWSCNRNEKRARSNHNPWRRDETNKSIKCHKKNPLKITIRTWVRVHSAELRPTAIASTGILHSLHDDRCPGRKTAGEAFRKTNRPGRCPTLSSFRKTEPGTRTWTATLNDNDSTVFLPARTSAIRIMMNNNKTKTINNNK